MSAHSTYKLWQVCLTNALLLSETEENGTGLLMYICSQVKIFPSGPTNYAIHILHWPYYIDKLFCDLLPEICKLRGSDSKSLYPGLALYIFIHIPLAQLQCEIPWKKIGRKLRRRIWKESVGRNTFGQGSI